MIALMEQAMELKTQHTSSAGMDSINTMIQNIFEDIKGAAMKNRVYCFTGTGNSLHVALEIAGALPDCDVVAIHKGVNFEIPQGLQRIGFVFPTYYWSLPAMAADFLGKAMFTISPLPPVLGWQEMPCHKQKICWRRRISN